MLVTKIKCILFLAVSLFAAVHGTSYKAGRRIIARNTAIPTPLSVTDRCIAENVGKTVCNTANPCNANELYMCSGVGMAGMTIGCSGAFPYCDASTPGSAFCSSAPGEGCQVAAPTFVCTGRGVFPDALNCRKYYFCPEKQGTAQEFECEQLYVFDPTAPNNDYCRLVNNDRSYCSQVTCDGTVRNILMSYRTFPTRLGQYVASCREGGSSPYVFRCEAGFQANLNRLPVQCNLVCTRPDRHAFPGDESKYYECYYTGSRWESRVQDCFRGSIFNSNLKRCVEAPTTTTTATTVSTD